MQTQTTQQSYADRMRAEALAKLKAYLRTGIEGLRQQGIDRLHAIGVNTDRCPGRDGAEHLVKYLELGWIG
jgi:hypothetical protein